MEFQEYPKAMYHGDQQCIVQDADHEERVRADGFVSCDELGGIAAEQVADDTDDKADKAALVEQAKALGIDANQRWGIKKLQDAIAAAGQ